MTRDSRGGTSRLAAPIALKTIIRFLEQEQHNLDEARMVLYNR
jgi:hypothetical protein